MGINLPGLDQLIVAALFTLVTTIASNFQLQPKIISPLAQPQDTVQSNGQTQLQGQNEALKTVKNGSTSSDTIVSPTGIVMGDKAQRSAISVETATDPTVTTVLSNQSGAAQQTSEISPTEDAGTAAATHVGILPILGAAPHTVFGKTTISSNGKTINLSLSFPSNGGAISGTMAGDCKGSVSGHFDGPQTENLSGTSQATCPAGFLSIPVSISYNGKMAQNDKQATIHYTILALGKKESGSTTLNLGN